MDAILSRCGFLCDLCLAYAPNVERDPASRQLLSKGWFTYFGFRIPPEKILCNGCLAENTLTLDADCPVRPCVIARGLENCALCPDYSCGMLQERLVTFEAFQQHASGEIPQADYLMFIRPYENKLRLEAIRAQHKSP